ncbi:MAG TPA: hypothetical protein VHS32_27610, partial [Streptosporangiaceae bacterium]|nr:hypothetical protein [Streptosporangiaceae bacterium]
MRFRVPVTRVFSLHVVQAGSARGPPDAAGPAPTAFNRAGEKLRATGGELPRVSYGVVPDAGTGSLSPSPGRKVKGTRSGAGEVKRWSGRLRGAARGVLAGGLAGG